MINAPVLLGIFNDHHILDRLHHTDYGMISPAIGTNRAYIVIAHIHANPAIPDLTCPAGKWYRQISPAMPYPA